MSEAVSLRRRRQFSILKELPNLRSLDEFPLTDPEIDPQVHVSKADVDQPFFLICEKDTVLVQMTGEGRVVFRDSLLLETPTEPGTFVYVPAGVPHRFLMSEPGALYRYKARVAGLEAVVFACERCGTELFRRVWDTAVTVPQQGWVDATEAFNTDVAARTCACCSTEHPPVDLTPFRWAAIAAVLRGEDEVEEEAAF